VRADARPQRRPADGCLSRVFHFPLLTMTTTYQSAGSRWIIVPMVMVTITLAASGTDGCGCATAPYGWSACPTAASTTSAETVGGVAIATSPAAMAYTTTETGSSP
jgi:hypothetical protein